MGHALVSDVEGSEYWLGDNIALHIRNGCTNGPHSHDDPFHFDLYAKGKFLYSDWFHKSWEYLAPKKSRDKRNMTPIHKYSIGHNTITVDKVAPDIQRVGNRDIVNDVTFSEIKKDGVMTSISLEGEPWGGVRMQRTFGLTSEYLIDVFECTSDTEHTYDYFLRDHGLLVLDKNIDTQSYNGFADDYGLEVIDKKASVKGNKWLRDGQKGTTDSMWEASFIDGAKKRVQLYVGAEPSTTIYKSDTPLLVWQGWDETPSDVRAMSRGVLIIRRVAKSTIFVVVHQLDKLDKKYDVQINGTSITIKGDGFKHNVVVENGQVKNFNNVTI